MDKQKNEELLELLSFILRNTRKHVYTNGNVDYFIDIELYRYLENLYEDKLSKMR